MKKRFREAGTALGEALAVRQDADIFAMFFADPVIENYMVNGACVVTVRGPLEHHRGYADSYEAITDRFREALEDDCPSVVLCIDSPGGVVSGLNQCVADMQRAKKASGKPVYVYVNEMACSAAYALATAGDEIILPPSGVVGSVGVISLMADQVGLDKTMGLNFVTITSGARKADGHPHTPISDAAVAAEQGRVDKLAQQFFALVSVARPLTPEKVKAQQAGIFLGQDAVSSGLADEVLGWEALLIALAQTHGTGGTQKKSVAQPDSTTAHYGRGGTQSTRVPMITIQALIAETKRMLIAEGDANKRKALAADLAKYEATLQAVKKTKIKYEETSTVDDGDEGDDGGGDEDASAAAAEDKPAGEDASAKQKADEAAAAAKDDSEEKKAESDEEEEKKALRAEAAKRGPKALAVFDNMMARDEEAKVLAKRVAKIEQRNENADRDARIATALGARKITKAEAEDLRAKPLAFVVDYLSLRKKAIVRGTDQAFQPGEKLPDSIENGYSDSPDAMSAHFSEQEAAENERMITDIVARSGGKITREQVMKDFNVRLSAIRGGAPKGRY